MNIKTYISTAVLVIVLFLPSLASAQIPQAVTDAYETLHGGKPYKSSFTSLTSVNIFGVQMQTDTKGSGSQDTEGDIRGTATMRVNISDPKKKTVLKNITYAMEFIFIRETKKTYFKFKRLPKELPPTMSKVRANVWYSQMGNENLTKLVGESPFSNEYFIAANKKYPAYVFKEKESTSKESVFAYSVNPAMIQNFLTEQARLKGDDSLSTNMTLVSELIGSTKGTLRITKKTNLPKSLVVNIGNDDITSQVSAIYIFPKIKDVVAPKTAISSEALDALFGKN